MRGHKLRILSLDLQLGRLLARCKPNAFFAQILTFDIDCATLFLLDTDSHGSSKDDVRI